MKKAFDSVENWTVFAAMDKSRIDSMYRNRLKSVYNNVAFQVKISDDIITNKIEVKREVRQGDIISPKLFTLAFEDVLQTLNWYGNSINIIEIKSYHL